MGDKLSQAVKGRMDEELAGLGLKITDLPPPDASRRRASRLHATFP